MKKQVDKHRLDIEFVVGDWVLVKLKPYHQLSLAHRLHHKLSPRYFGPFIIQAKISAMAYHIELPKESLIHNVFHISLLRKYKGNIPPKEVADLPQIAVRNEPVIYLVVVMGERTLLIKGKQVDQILIKWTGLGAEDSLWENKTDMFKLFPSLNLEDKVNQKGVGDDRDRLVSRGII